MIALSRIASVVCAIALTLGWALPAQAVSDDERYEALWYARALKFDELQAAGHTGAGVKVAVIDRVINLEAAELQGANVHAVPVCKSSLTGEVVPAESNDPALSHGTEVVAMIVGNGVAADDGSGTRGIAPAAEVAFYGYGQELEGADEGVPEICNAASPAVAKIMGEFKPDLTYAVAAAVLDGADIVSISTVSGYEGAAGGWDEVLALAAKEGVPIVAATANPDYLGFSDTLNVPYPLNGVVAVSGVDPAAEPLGKGMPGVIDPEGAPGSRNLAVAAPGDVLLAPVNDGAWKPGVTQGTSLSTPLVAGALALGMQAYPDASAYQVLQAMIHTTGGEFAETPTWYDRRLGYGYMSPRGILAVDPTQFPDENPLFVKDVSDPRCGGAAVMAECAWATHPTTEDFERIWAEWDTVPTDAEQAPAEPQSGNPLLALLWVSGGILLLGLIATAIIVPVVVSRVRKRRVAQQLAYAQWYAQQGVAHPPGLPLHTTENGQQRWNGAGQNQNGASQ